jgi:hypothetical protein
MGKAIRIGTLALGGAVAVLSMAACTPAFGQKNNGAPAPVASAPAPDASSAPASPAADAKNGKSEGTDKGDGSGGGGGNGSGNGSGSGSGGGQGGAQIVSFTIVQQPRCPSGTTKYETPAVPLKISWKVTGATGIALSVDDPHRVGSYGSYGTEGTLEFTFSCGGKVGSTETHEYTLTTTGGTGHPKSKTLTVSTKVLEKGVPV